MERFNRLNFGGFHGEFMGYITGSPAGKINILPQPFE
jgi:hypothetical protein